MIDINDLLRWPGLVAILIVVAAGILISRLPRVRALYARGEWVVLGKLAFVLVALMLLIAVHNATDQPGGQFIYGRF